jgi:hypothetical protein
LSCFCFSFVGPVTVDVVAWVFFLAAVERKERAGFEAVREGAAVGLFTRSAAGTSAVSEGEGAEVGSIVDPLDCGSGRVEVAVGLPSEPKMWLMLGGCGVGMVEVLEALREEGTGAETFSVRPVAWVWCE